MRRQKSIQIEFIATRLTAWFKHNMRPLPWRKNYQPYSVWVAEIMLQQTRVNTVLPYFNKFITRFPNLTTLAKTPPEELLKLWEGLGYYRRALNMLATAQQIIQHHQGQFPSNKKDLTALPGIGVYTAGAIISAAFNQPVAVLDGNAMRVFSRLLDWEKDVTKAETLQYFENISVKLAQAGSPRILQQAVMELGATVCTKQPICDVCPLNQVCQAYQNKTQAERPVKPVQVKTTTLFTNYLVVEQQQQFLLQKQPAKAWWAGMWVFPFASANTANLATQKLKVLSRQIGLSHFTPCTTPWLCFQHHVTRYKVRAQVYQHKIEPGLLNNSQLTWFSPEQLATLSLPKASFLIRQQLNVQLESTAKICDLAP